MNEKKSPAIKVNSLVTILRVLGSLTECLYSLSFQVCDVYKKPVAAACSYMSVNHWIS